MLYFLKFFLADLALDTRRGPGRASGRGPPYAGPLPQREPPSPAQSRRPTQQQHQFDTLERRPSVSKMHRTASTADISEYKINEGAIKLLAVSDLILLIASLVMVATGKFSTYISQCWAKIRKKCNLEKRHCLAQ